MYTTPPTLLYRLCHSGEQEAWQRFVDLYAPLIHYWVRQTGMQECDTVDLVQDVFLLLLGKLPEFQYDKSKSFRGWLRTVTHNKWREKNRRAKLPTDSSLFALDDVSGTESVGEIDDVEYRQYVVARALSLMKSEFQPNTWKACWEVIVSDRPAAEVANELEMSLGAVYAAKSRVLRRLRQELKGILELSVPQR